MVVARRAAGHTIVKIGFSAFGNRYDVIDGQRLLLVAAIDTGIPITHKYVFFGKRNTIAVNTAHDLEQHHHRRR